MTVYGDGAASAEASLAPDRGTTPAPDLGPLPDGQPAKKDTAAPAKPDTASPSAPQPPFGTTIGTTAKNFTGVPDCAGKAYDLYSYYKQKRGVIIAMMSPS